MLILCQLRCKMVWFPILKHLVLFIICHSLFISSEFHSLNIFNLPSVHFQRSKGFYCINRIPDKRNMGAVVSVSWSAFVADENTDSWGGPLGVFRLTVKADLKYWIEEISKWVYLILRYKDKLINDSISFIIRHILISHWIFIYF